MTDTKTKATRTKKADTSADKPVKTSKPAAKKAPPEKAVAKKAVAKKPVAKKPVAKKPATQKPVAKKTVAKQPAAKKPAAKTTTATKPAKSPAKTAATAKDASKTPAKTAASTAKKAATKAAAPATRKATPTATPAAKTATSKAAPKKAATRATGKTSAKPAAKTSQTGKPGAGAAKPAAKGKTAKSAPATAKSPKPSAATAKPAAAKKPAAKKSKSAATPAEPVQKERVEGASVNFSSVQEPPSHLIMRVDTNRVVAFHYRLCEVRPDGNRSPWLEASFGRQPLLYLHGHGNVVPGLEQAMAGKRAGDRIEITLLPEQAYGPRTSNELLRVPIKHLHRAPERKNLVPGAIVSVKTNRGVKNALVIKVGKFNVDLDTNHPYAGRTLHYQIEVLGVRQASAEEVAHRHVHGPGGHQH